jgi:hypothetical protein
MIVPSLNEHHQLNPNPGKPALDDRNPSGAPRRTPAGSSLRVNPLDSAPDVTILMVSWLTRGHECATRGHMGVLRGDMSVLNGSRRAARNIPTATPPYLRESRGTLNILDIVHFMCEMVCMLHGFPWSNCHGKASNMATEVWSGWPTFLDCKHLCSSMIQSSELG